jgi:Flp pilus assembly protein TadD
MGADKQKVELAMASFYSMQRKTDEGEQMYLSVLKDDATNRAALLGLARLALRKMDFDSARTYLARLRESGADEATVGIEEAIVESVAGNIPSAKAKLLKLVEDNPKNLSIWNTLAIIALADKDEELRLSTHSRGGKLPGHSEHAGDAGPWSGRFEGDAKVSRQYSPD